MLSSVFNVKTTNKNDISNELRRNYGFNEKLTGDTFFCLCLTFIVKKLLCLFKQVSISLFDLRFENFFIILYKNNCFSTIETVLKIVFKKFLVLKSKILYVS